MKNIFTLLLSFLSVFSLTHAQTLTTSALSSSSFCQNGELDVPYTISGSYNSGNVFTAQLSDETGSFASATAIGTLTATSAGTISATLPNLLTSGTNYRIRVVSSDPAVTGSDNGTDLDITGATLDPSTFGSNSWNVFCYSIDSYTNNVNNFDFSDYRGYYTEAGVNFNSTDLWNDNSNPSTAPGYVGCEIGNNRHNVQYKREGFPCGYYQVNIASESGQAGFDDAAKLIIDGTTVWSNGGCCQAINNVWSGILSSTSQVEFVWSENGGRSYGRVTFVQQNFPTVTPDVTICAGSSTTLTASGASNYDWSTNSTHLVAPLNTASVVVSPAGGTANSVETYTVTATDATSGCVLSNTVDVTINPLPNTSVTPNSGSYCGSGTVDVEASGANTYTYSPMTGVTLNSASGHLATLSPTTTTTYTVTGSNNCATSTATVTVTVTNPTGDPNDFGNNTWNVYCYNGNNFNTYNGFYVHSGQDFDSRDVWSNNSSPSNAAGYSGCSIPNDQHSFRYKREGFPCGYYSIDMPNHDDHVRLIIDGVTVFSQNSWFQNIYKADVWSGYLDENSQVEMNVREFGGGSNAGLIFNYIAGPSNGANQTVWNGNVSNDWFDPANWCSVVPSGSIEAIIPDGLTNYPEITTSGSISDGVVIKAGATLTISGSNTLEVTGNWDNDGTFVANSSTVEFTGSDPATIGGEAITTFNDITINKSITANAITLDTMINIAGGLSLTNGIMNASTDTLVLNAGASITEVSNSSYVRGSVQKVGSTAFTFPLGGANLYRPIAISAPGNPTDHFTATYFPSNPDATYSTTTLVSSLDHVSTCEYWILDRTGGSSNVTVELSWASNSCGVTNPDDLAVVRWDGSRWQNHGNGSVTGGASSGTVTSSAAITSFSPFTLGSTSGANPLPIELVSFDATATPNKTVQLDWVTAAEINNEFFTIERSQNLEKWEEIQFLPGQGTTTQTTKYSTLDERPYSGVSYYRLKQTDFNGDFEYSSVVSVAFDGGTTSITAYPNPTTDRVYIEGSNLTPNGFVLYSSLGKAVGGQAQVRYVREGLVEVNLTSLPAGVYTVVTSNGKAHQKIIKR